MWKIKKLQNIIKQSVTLVILSSILACAGNPPGADRVDSGRSDCISQPSIRGYTVLDESNLIVSASGRRPYHMVLHRRAYGLRSNWAIGFKSPTGRVCAGFSELVIDDRFSGDDSIRIASIRAINADEEEDLLIRYGKKEPEYEHTPEPREVKGADVEELDPAADDESSRD